MSEKTQPSYAEGPDRETRKAFGDVGDVGGRLRRLWWRLARKNRPPRLPGSAGKGGATTPRQYQESDARGWKPVLWDGRHVRGLSVDLTLRSRTVEARASAGARSLI